MYILGNQERGFLNQILTYNKKGITFDNCGKPGYRRNVDGPLMHSVVRLIYNSKATVSFWRSSWETLSIQSETVKKMVEGYTSRL